jgi:hypothetical protein
MDVPPEKKNVDFAGEVFTPANGLIGLGARPSIVALANGINSFR